MGISGIPAISMIITCLLQGTLCDTGIPRTFYGGKFAVYYLSKNPSIFNIISWFAETPEQWTHRPSV